MRPSFFLAAVLLAGVLACHRQAPAPEGGYSVRNVITREQIDSSGQSTVYDVIVRIHPEFFRDRGIISIKTNQRARAVVFLNDQEYGVTETLRNFPASGVGEVRYFSGTEAASKFGSQYGGGVIQLISRVD